MKTPMARAAKESTGTTPSVKENQRFSSGCTTTTSCHSPPATRESEVVIGIPIEAAGREIHGIVDDPR